MAIHEIQSAVNTLANVIGNEFATINYSIGTNQNLVEINIQAHTNILLETIQLMFSDLLNEVTSSNQHRLFYLKGKIGTLDNGQLLTMAQLNYLAILQTELAKFNTDNKLSE